MFSIQRHLPQFTLLASRPHTLPPLLGVAPLHLLLPVAVEEVAVVVAIYLVTAKVILWNTSCHMFCFLVFG